MTTGQWAWVAVILFELGATVFHKQTLSQEWWQLGRTFWWFRWVVGPTIVTWLWFHFTVPTFR
jgi:hypothetical protein